MKGKRVVITGGSSGIGLATAKALAAKGAAVIIASRSAEKLQCAQQEIGHDCRTAVLDLTDEAAVKAFFDEIGAFDHLVTAAAGSAFGLFLELETRAARDLVESKLWSQYNTAKYAVPKIKRGGSITFFSGVVSRKAIPGGSAFAIVAGAMEALTRVLALELAPLRVNCLTPGQIDTPVWRDILPDDAMREARLGDLVSKIAVGRIGTAQEAADAVLFLIQNGFMSGSVVDLDGGLRVAF